MDLNTGGSGNGGRSGDSGSSVAVMNSKDFLEGMKDTAFIAARRVGLKG